MSEKQQSSSYSLLHYLIVISILVSLVSFVIHSRMTKGFERYFKINDKVWSKKEIELRDEILRLRKQFNQDDRTWSTVFTGINRTASTSEISVFLLLNKGEEVGTRIAGELGEITKAHLGSYGDVVRIKGSNLVEALKEPRDLFLYLNKVKKSKVMIVHELEEIPISVVQHFHSFCDKENPLIPGAVYYFILKYNKDRSKPILPETIEFLEHMWSEMDDSIRFPLITRIVQNVIEINNGIR